MKKDSALLPTLFFMASVTMLGIFYGWWSATTHVFPDRVLKDALASWIAWRSVIFGGGRDVPALHQGWVAQAEKISVNERPDDAELILVAGGPYQLLERCPRFGCIAWLMDRRGEVRHVWEADLDELWSDVKAFEGVVERSMLYPAGHVLLPGGELFVTFQGANIFPYTVGAARLDKTGKILWKRMEYYHHWPTKDDRGRIFVEAARIAPSPLPLPGTMERIDCTEAGKKIYADHLVELGPAGEEVRAISIIETLAASNFAGVLRDECDPTHLNSIQVATASIAARAPWISEGDFLISLRTPSVVAVLDGQTGRVKRAVTGRTIEQHSPKFLPDGRVLVFDNQGGDQEKTGGSRVVALDLATGDVELVFPRGGEKIWSETAGHLDISPDGKRALVSVSGESLVYEIELESGRVLWRFHNTHDSRDRYQALGFATDPEKPLGQFRTMGAYYTGMREVSF